MTANNPPIIETQQLTCGDWSASVSSIGARLVELRHGQTVLTTSSWLGASQWFSGCTLFPWVNRLDAGTWTLNNQTFIADVNDTQNNCANHGLVFNHSFETSAQSEQSISFALTLDPGKAYPAQMQLGVTLTLSEAGLSVSYEVHNASKIRAPFAIGGHPYLLAELESVLEFQAGERIEVDSRMLPSARTELTVSPIRIEVANRKHYTDACFTELGDKSQSRTAAQLSRPETNQVVTVWQDQSFTHLQVFTLQTGRSDRPNLVALEPQTSPANALNTGDGLIWLEANESWSGSWGITIGDN